MDTPLKRCKQCSEEKPLTEFYKKRGCKDGVLPICKICRTLNDGFTPRAWREQLPAGHKRCTACHQVLPENTEHFHRTPKGSGFLSICRPCRSARRIAEYRDNPIAAEKEKQRVKSWYHSNPDHARALKRRSIAKYRPQEVERVRKWRELNPDRYYAHNAYSPKRYAGMKRRRAHKYNAGGSHSEIDILIQYISQHGRCFWCSLMVGQVYHVDHITALARGGSDNPDNLAIACPSCNGSKQDRLPYVEWMPPNPLRKD